MSEVDYYKIYIRFEGVYKPPTKVPKITKKMIRELDKITDKYLIVGHNIKNNQDMIINPKSLFDREFNKKQEKLKNDDYER